MTPVVIEPYRPRTNENETFLVISNYSNYRGPKSIPFIHAVLSGRSIRMENQFPTIIVYPLPYLYTSMRFL